jgi:quercetin dioxygenase-like cupin family protein
MARSQTIAQAEVVQAGEGESLWFFGTHVRVKLDAEQTAGRLGMFEVVFPRGAAPPLHSHPEDETFYVLEGELTAWLVPAQLAAADDGDPPAWVAERARTCGRGAVLYAPGGTPHTFRVESDTARLLILSTPAGIEAYARALSEPAQWPWPPAPPDGPRVAPERLQAVGRELGVVNHGPPPPPPPPPAGAARPLQQPTL